MRWPWTHPGRRILRLCMFVLCLRHRKLPFRRAISMLIGNSSCFDICCNEKKKEEEEFITYEMMKSSISYEMHNFICRRRRGHDIAGRRRKRSHRCSLVRHILQTKPEGPIKNQYRLTLKLLIISMTDIPSKRRW